jgi:enterochelin esterase family protein
VCWLVPAATAGDETHASVVYIVGISPDQDRLARQSPHAGMDRDQPLEHLFDDAVGIVDELLHQKGLQRTHGWSTIGRACFILDNLIAAGNAVPMIVVMPNGSLPPPKDMPARPAAGEAPSAEFRAAMEKMQNRFTDELMKEIVPTFEKTYRVKTGSENRALAGLSMGGGQTLRVLIMHPAEFACLGIWSTGIFGANAEQW